MVKLCSKRFCCSTGKEDGGAEVPTPRSTSAIPAGEGPPERFWVPRGQVPMLTSFNYGCTCPRSASLSPAPWGFGLPHPSPSPAQDGPRNATDMAERGSRGWGQNRPAAAAPSDLCLNQPERRKAGRSGEVQASFNWRTRGFILVLL